MQFLLGGLHKLPSYLQYNKFSRLPLLTRERSRKSPTLCNEHLQTSNESSASNKRPVRLHTLQVVRSIAAQKHIQDGSPVGRLLPDLENGVHIHVYSTRLIYELCSALGTPLDWPEAKKNAGQVREWGIEQLLAIWNRAKGKERDALLWGDEVRPNNINFWK